jgi:hypothetical protein
MFVSIPKAILMWFKFEWFKFDHIFISSHEFTIVIIFFKIFIPKAYF